MTDLLSQDVLHHILQETGASGEHKIRRVLKGDFKNFNFQVHKKEIIEHSFINQGLELIKQAMTVDWKLNYVEGCEILREPEQLIYLSKYPFRMNSFCCQFNTSLVKEPFLVYFGTNTFFYLFNIYLGGDQVTQSNQKKQLTEIEKFFFGQVVEGLRVIINDAFGYLDKLDLKLTNLTLADEEQHKEFSEKHLVSEFYFIKNKKDYKISLAVPSAFLNLIRENQAKKTQLLEKKKDPLWQEAVTSAFLQTSLDLSVSLGKLNIPFEKSVSLKAGDVLSWDKQNPDVIIYQDNKPRIQGTLGVVEGNFAVRVSDLVGS